jgi:restriction system protein
MLGPKSVHSEECFKGNFIGTDFGVHMDLSKELIDNWKEFNRKFIPIYLENRQAKTKVAAGLACGTLWTVSKGIKEGDIVLSPNGKGGYYVGEVSGGYEYHPGKILFHRRPMKWYSNVIDKTLMSDSLRNSAGGPGTAREITHHSNEIEQLISGNRPATIISTDATVEDPSVFALEKHLEDFLVQNWKQTELGKKYDIYEVDGEIVGQQFPSDTGPIDILAISHDKKELLVVELKKGRASDSVVGQIQRYMGYVIEELAENGQTVRGVIIALEDDNRIRRALSVANNIEFYRYQVSFKLFKG